MPATTTTTPNPGWGHHTWAVYTLHNVGCRCCTKHAFTLMGAFIAQSGEGLSIM